MAEEFVNRAEFEDFKKETKENFKAINAELKDDKDLLHKIDKNVDSIVTKLKEDDKSEKTEKSLTEQIIDLKMAPIKEKVDSLEKAKTWLVRLLAAAIIGLVFEAVAIVIK